MEKTITNLVSAKFCSYLSVVVTRCRVKYIDMKFLELIYFSCFNSQVVLQPYCSFKVQLSSAARDYLY